MILLTTNKENLARAIHDYFYFAYAKVPGYKRVAWATYVKIV